MAAATRCSTRSLRAHAVVRIADVRDVHACSIEEFAAGWWDVSAWKLGVPFEEFVGIDSIRADEAVRDGEWCIARRDVATCLLAPHPGVEAPPLAQAAG